MHSRFQNWSINKRRIHDCCRSNQGSCLTKAPPSVVPNASSSGEKTTEYGPKSSISSIWPILLMQLINDHLFNDTVIVGNVRAYPQYNPIHQIQPLNRRNPILFSNTHMLLVKTVQTAQIQGRFRVWVRKIDYWVSYVWESYKKVQQY